MFHCSRRLTPEPFDIMMKDGCASLSGPLWVSNQAERTHVNCQIAWALLCVRNEVNLFCILFPCLQFLVIKNFPFQWLQLSRNILFFLWLLLSKMMQDKNSPRKFPLGKWKVGKNWKITINLAYPLFCAEWIIMMMITVLSQPTKVNWLKWWIKILCCFLTFIRKNPESHDLDFLTLRADGIACLVHATGKKIRKYQWKTSLSHVSDAISTTRLLKNLTRKIKEDKKIVIKIPSLTLVQCTPSVRRHAASEYLKVVFCGFFYHFSFSFFLRIPQCIHMSSHRTHSRFYSHEISIYRRHPYKWSMRTLNNDNDWCSSTVWRKKVNQKPLKSLVVIAVCVWDAWYGGDFHFIIFEYDLMSF